MSERNQNKLISIDRNGVHINITPGQIIAGIGVSAVATGLTVFGPDAINSFANIFSSEPKARTVDCTYSTTIQEGDVNAMKAFQRGSGGQDYYDVENQYQLFYDAEHAHLRKEAILQDGDDYSVKKLDNVNIGDEIYWDAETNPDGSCPEQNRSRDTYRLNYNK